MSNSALIDAKVDRSEIVAASDLLRVMMWKSANLTFSVTVPPPAPRCVAIMPDFVDQRTKFGSHAVQAHKVS